MSYADYVIFWSVGQLHIYKKSSVAELSICNTIIRPVLQVSPTSQSQTGQKSSLIILCRSWVIPPTITNMSRELWESHKVGHRISCCSDSHRYSPTWIPAAEVIGTITSPRTMNQYRYATARSESDLTYLTSLGKMHTPNIDRGFRARGAGYVTEARSWIRLSWLKHVPIEYQCHPAWEHANGVRDGNIPNIASVFGILIAPGQPDIPTDVRSQPTWFLFPRT